MADAPGALVPHKRRGIEIVEQGGGMQVLAPAPSTPRSLRNTSLALGGAAALDAAIVYGFFHHVLNLQLFLFASTGVALFAHKLLWQRFGREALTLEADHLLLHQQLGPLKRTRKLPLGQIRQVRTQALDAEALGERQPVKLGEAGRVVIEHAGGVVALFGGADPAEAERIVERIRRALREHAERNVRFR